jgi:hypothetical protein
MPDPVATPDPAPRRRLSNVSDLSLVPPIGNRQATFAWTCASWGLIPIAGLPLGLLGVLAGVAGIGRALMRPADGGLRYAIAAIIFGLIEVPVNVMGLWYIIDGIRRLQTG